MDDQEGAPALTGIRALDCSRGVAAAYTEPKCGKMYFECPAGEEGLCRMQWQDVRNAVGKGYCAGFGA